MTTEERLKGSYLQFQIQITGNAHNVTEISLARTRNDVIVMVYVYNIIKSVYNYARILTTLQPL